MSNSILIDSLFFFVFVFYEYSKKKVIKGQKRKMGSSFHLIMCNKIQAILINLLFSIFEIE